MARKNRRDNSWVEFDPEAWEDGPVFKPSTKRHTRYLRYGR